MAAEEDPSPTATRGGPDKRALSEEAQSQQEELQAQAEELRAANEQLIETQRTLSDSEARFRSLYEHAPIGIVTYRDGRILQANSAAARIFGHHVDDLLGTRASRLIAPQCRDEIAELVRRRERGEAVPSAYETVGEKSDGSQFPLFVESAPVALPDGSATVVFLTDVTERKRAEKAQFYLAAIVESSEDAIVGKALDGTIESWNAGAERLYGYPSVEAVGKPIDLVVPSDRSAELREVIERVARGERVDFFETVRLHRDGRRVDVSLRVSPIKDGDGRITGASSTARDVSERKRLRDELRRAHEVLESKAVERTAELVRANEVLRAATAERQRVENERDRLFAHSQDLLVSIGFDGVVRQVNPAIETILGFKAEEVVGKPFAEFVCAEDLAAAMTEFQVLLVGTPSTSFECRCGKDGSQEWLQFTVRVDAEAGLIHAVGRDVTEQRQLEEALRESENRYRALFEHLPSGFAYHEIVVDESGRPADYRFLEINPAFEELTGLRRDKVLGSKVTEAVPGIERSAFDWIGTYGNVALTGQPAVFDHLAEPLGRHYSVTAYSPARGTFATVFTDVTERKRIEDRLLKTNRALRMLSDCNQALMRSGDEDTLLREACRIVVEVGGYRLAWVGFVEDEATKSVYPVASMGFDEGYVAAARKVWSDDEHGRGPVGTAIETGRPGIGKDFLSDPTLAPWRDEAIKRGFAAIIALPLVVESRVIGALAIYSADSAAFDDEEVALLQEIARDVSYGVEALRIGAERNRVSRGLQESLEKLNSAFEGTIRAVALTVEMRDPYTAGHQRRVAALSATIAAAMGFAEDRIKGIHLAAMVHDIGKISIPAEVLSRPGRISPAEYQLVKGHVESGADILSSIDFPWPIAQIVIQHHERMDGSGYPAGLAGEAILVEARVLAVADVLEAMASHRPYRRAFGLATALEEITSGKGVLYDPDVVDACVRVCSSGSVDFLRLQ